MKMLGGKIVDKLAGASFVDSYSLVHPKNERSCCSNLRHLEISFLGITSNLKFFFLGLQIPEAAHASCHFFRRHPKDYHGIPRHKPFLPEPSDAAGWASRAFRAAQSSEKALQQVPRWGSFDVGWCFWQLRNFLFFF